MRKNSLLSLRYKNKIKSEINVTPFVDVMLVLLIIFMLTSHIINTGIEIDLPRGKENINSKSSQLNITVDKEENIYIQQTKVDNNELVSKVLAILKENPKINIVIYGDKECNYGSILNIFSILRQASINNVTLMTEE